MANIPSTMAIKRSEFGLQLSTAVLIAFAVGLVLLQLSVRFGVPLDSFDVLIF
jgi:hypothetical protein